MSWFNVLGWVGVVLALGAVWASWRFRVRAEQARREAERMADRAERYAIRAEEARHDTDAALAEIRRLTDQQLPSHPLIGFGDAPPDLADRPTTLKPPRRRDQ
jgi:type VI protein secretion system component VasK